MTAEPALRQEAEATWTEPDLAAHRAEARGRAISVPQPAVLPLDQPRVALTERDLAAAAERASGWLTALAEGRHVTGHHPSLAGARERHHEAAGEWNAPLVKGARLAWAYGIHLPVKSALMLIEWLLETPLRSFGVAVIALLTYFLVIRR